jgi:hypothetical protein
LKISYYSLKEIEQKRIKTEKNRKLNDRARARGGERGKLTVEKDVLKGFNIKGNRTFPHISVIVYSPPQS